MRITAKLARKRPVWAYYLLTFAASWGLFLLVGGRDLVGRVDWDTSSAFPLAILGMLCGPAIAGLVLTAHLSGRAGLRDLLGRLRRWRVSARWYAVALLTAPLVTAFVLLGLSLTSAVFRPVFLTEEFTAATLLSAVGIGFTTLLEELGWTGFATPRLRLRHGVFATGLIVGVLWGVWHLLQIIWVGRSTSEDVPLAVYLTLYVGFGVAGLTAYRVLMVWVYDRTRSLLVVTLMHASYAGSTLQIDLLVPKLTGTDLLVQGWILAAALWFVVAAAALATGRSFFGTASIPPPAPGSALQPESGMRRSGRDATAEVP